jgi:hypothetical protein
MKDSIYGHSYLVSRCLLVENKVDQTILNHFFTDVDIHHVI